MEGVGCGIRGERKGATGNLRRTFPLRVQHQDQPAVDAVVKFSRGFFLTPEYYRYSLPKPEMTFFSLTWMDVEGQSYLAACSRQNPNSLKEWIIANVIAGARFVCFIHLSESALQLGAGMATERCSTRSVLSTHFEWFLLFCQVDMYAVESHRFAESWIFTATNDSVVSKANCFYGTSLDSEII